MKLDCTLTEIENGYIAKDNNSDGDYRYYETIEQFLIDKIVKPICHIEAKIAVNKANEKQVGTDYRDHVPCLSVVKFSIDEEG